MNNFVSRRSFLENASKISTSIVLLSSSTVMSALTRDESPFKGYNPYAEEKTDLRVTGFGGNHVTVKGKVYDQSGINPVSNACIEVWHLSPKSNKYRHMAKLNTNALGEFEFISDFPNKEQGKAARMNFRVSNGDNSYFTELMMNDFGAFISGEHWEKNQQLKNKLFPQKETFLNHTTIKFNLSI